MRKLFSICIPAYNRHVYLSPLLDSIFAQDFGDFEVVICEDKSPERALIAKVVREYQERHPGCIVYVENDVNLGYDGNIRRLVEVSTGEYCLFMGNDDLLCAGALKAIADAIRSRQDCGVVVRSYASFDRDPEDFKQVFRYFPKRHVLQAGAQAISTAYRRSVVISGMVVHRDTAARFSTNRFDGTLLYQLYLVGMILATRSVVFVPEVIALRRDGTPPDFGNSDSERGKFVPHDQTPESSIHFMKGMLQIARFVSDETKLDVFEGIRADIGHYAYPILSIQANRPFGTFVRYGVELGSLGLWRYALFHVYFLALLTLGPVRSDGIIKFIKTKLGYTPRLGSARESR